MNPPPTFDDIFAVMSGASVGDMQARVALPDDPQLDDTATRFAIGLNLLLDDLAFRSAELEVAHRVTQLELERMVAERTAALQAANQDLEAFTYSVSHDLRSPLRAIDGFVSMLVEDYASDLPHDARRYLEVVRSNAQRMSQLIEDLLAFSRLGQQPVNRRTVAPDGLVREVVDELRGVQPERHIEVIIGDLPECQADPALLKQVYVNLLANAFKFTRQRETAVVEIGCIAHPALTEPENGSRPAGESPVYFVKDNGAGFDRRYAHKLFGVFQRLHDAQTYEGTGVGLAIVQRIIQRHGGRVWAEAEVDQGATFYFTL
jgi:signal transduction histidine kinase